MSWRRAREAENDTVELLRDAGLVAYRLAHGRADVVALAVGEVPRLIQVKTTAGGPYERFLPADRARLLEEARLAGARAVLCWWPPDGRIVPTWLYPEDWPAAVVAA